MLFKMLTIAKNTFTETLRQPIYVTIILAALLMLFISPSLSVFTMGDDNKLLREICYSTLFLTGLFVAIFSASGAITEEIENKTIITVLSKPVQRPIFILGKFFGIAAAVTLAHYLCTIALFLTIRDGVMESASDYHDMPVLVTVAFITIATISLTAFLNYLYDWKFSSTAIILTAIFATLGIIFLFFIDSNWRFNPQNNGFTVFDMYASILLLLAAIVLTAIAVMFSTRFNIVVTLTCCIGVFLLGLITDYVFGRFADVHLWAKIGRLLIPNLQIFWISDAIYEESPIPLKYIAISSSYAICYTLGILSLAVALFQKRQVG